MPLAPGMEETPFLHGWTRCETIAKITGYPALGVWKKLRHRLLFATGTQFIAFGNHRLTTYSDLQGDLVFSLAHT